MPFYIPIAFKNVFRDLRRSITLGINYFFIALLLLLVFAITEGVKKNITENVITSTAGHITISGEYIIKGRTFQGIKDYPRIIAAVTNVIPGTRVVTRYNVSSAVYYKGVSKRLSFVGIDTTADNGLRDQITLSPGAWDGFAKQDNGIVMPAAIAGYFSLTNNDELLISTRSRFGAFNTGNLKVSGIYRTGNYFLRDSVIAHFRYLQSLDLADTTTASKIYLYFPVMRDINAKRDQLIQRLVREGFIAVKPASSADAMNAVSSASPRYKVQDESVNQIRLTLATVDEVTGIVTQVVATINGIGLFIAAIMLFIISISIFINMRMTINERMQEIGTLRAIGTERGDIVAMFIVENVFLSLVFVAAGLAAGLLMTGVFSTLVTLPAEGTLGLFLNRGHFVLVPTIASMGFITLTLVLFTALFSYFPARYGGKIPAVVALNKTN